MSKEISIYYFFYIIFFYVFSAVRKIEYSLYKLYFVTASQSTGSTRNEKLTEFFHKLMPELQGQNEWKDWFSMKIL